MAARSGVASKPEVGIGDVKLSGLGRRHGMTHGLKPTLKVMQWHHAEVQEVPEGAEVLATSPITKVQIMSVADTLLATQFHAELTPALIERWAHIPQYIDWLNEALGPDAYPRVRAKALPLMPQLERMSRTPVQQPHRRQGAAPGGVAVPHPPIGRALPISVTPAKAGAQTSSYHTVSSLGPGFRRDDSTKNSVIPAKAGIC